MTSSFLLLAANATAETEMRGMTDADGNFKVIKTWVSEDKKDEPQNMVNGIKVDGEYKVFKTVEYTNLH